MEKDVSRLTLAAANGDAEAVDELLERYLPELRAFVRLRAGALIRARESTSDIVQSVCREVLLHQERFQFGSECGFKRWLYTTALRKLVDRRDFYLAQKRDVLRNVPLEVETQDSDRRLLECYGSFTTPSRNAIVREELERVESAFEGLSDEQREVITLAHIVGLSRAEMATEMGKSEGAVRVLLHRALAKISELLTQ